MLHTVTSLSESIRFLASRSIIEIIRSTEKNLLVFWRDLIKFDCTRFRAPQIKKHLRSPVAVFWREEYQVVAQTIL